ncbi:MAG: type I glyceraldehyde-3-phosphate dehydrogenase [Candidatus Kerfeldbacteria bacterium RIFCSPHIGHO2_02_FULL_42_14]|uniref:Glyceraldehyde-3-phosphate dehydrogenase n=1 Tax=Candidatus Kerfeldbacteria bacterium RIFCSPHIGHO2_02_FULL_42_14 TaxID=1798540 RepID=A0A1G2ARQ4_9BACT|nr:MAG: type I glyceraldehyde-3-phosphate dehydrogenase [Candidatus Kerfeldbacteria bacterium RIFCSPHIGHO2_02_FULL_42_14]OGY80385.1 MAG: type I glyceraldehyde-3-phosphate dehydrogenase [Candidatus Kerfeldbacteria bacterium RIFCSPHIGHO2_12_FULL_42_13]OGY83814.1 MAG: type I glyceraldehyde-3-phosphate dehydrogenase [Candidatus Kerfeldbacteria bacterium RIFCSPLOWO2_02_FULL_42_19]OGY87148.1 MAG: type I glyceraldehyde-3-phosphate dehydrogenase [Candidatus Kerfeldbacteria bacterium RIFCSPLOWO2_12_FULL_
MKSIRIAINGFGRTGMAAFKIARTFKNITIVALNDLSSAEICAYRLRYDTVHGVSHEQVKAGKDFIQIGKEKYRKFTSPNIEDLPWKKYNVDVVLECTGVFIKKADAMKHLEAGAKNVIISAPAKGDDPVGTYVIGVNHTKLDAKKERIISNASCTTNCISPVMAIMHNAFGIKKALMTTVHAYTASQALVDGGKGKDLRETRAAAMNIIPSSTGAAKATTLTIPELKGKFDGIAMRVPIVDGSISDITMLTKKTVTVEQVNNVFRKMSKHPFYRQIVAVTEDPIVSSDIVGTTYSAIVDLPLTRVVDNDLVKVVAWYDNEWGYAHRLVEQALEVGRDI